MFFVKKSKGVDMNLVDKIVRAYFEYASGLSVSLSGDEVAELLRVALCRLLNLQTRGCTQKIDALSEGVVIRLSDVIADSDVNNLSLDCRQGLLEACVHCIVLSRKRANVE